MWRPFWVQLGFPLDVRICDPTRTKGFLLYAREQREKDTCQLHMAFMPSVTPQRGSSPPNLTSISPGSIWTDPVATVGT